MATRKRITTLVFYSALLLSVGCEGITRTGPRETPKEQRVLEVENKGLQAAELPTGSTMQTEPRETPKEQRVLEVENKGLQKGSTAEITPGSTTQTDPREMPKEHLDIKVENKGSDFGFTAEIPDGSTVGTMPPFSIGHVKWSFVHVDEDRKAWIDQDAPVYGLGKLPNEERPDRDFYLSVWKGDWLHYHPNRHKVEILRSSGFKWKPSPKPPGKRFILADEVEVYPPPSK
jgi:hypothetical protein